MRPVRIGSLRLRSCLFLAPMAALTDRAFRHLIQEIGGPGLLFSEMVSCDAIARRNERTMRMVQPVRGPIPQILQLFGADPRQFTATLRILENEHNWQGYDINMGCPVPKVTRRGAGVRLMKTPAVAARILRAVRRETGKLVSVKLRLGYQPEDLFDLIPLLEAEGVDLISVHFRLKDDRYSDPPRWEYAADLRQRITKVFAGNGDVNTVIDARERLTHVDALLIGRGAISDPFVFHRINEASSAHVNGSPWTRPAAGMPAFERLGQLIESHYPPVLQLSRFKHYFRYMVTGQPQARECRRELYASGSMQQARARLRRFFASRREPVDE